MNIDRVLQSLAKNEVDYLLIGGVNFLLRHAPEITYDIDVWIADNPKNLERTVTFLKSINAEWGATEDDWKPVPDTTTWLTLQPVFCLTSPIAAIDIFREVKGLEKRYDVCKAAAIAAETASGVPFWALSDQHMLEAQLALPVNQQKSQRIEALNKAIKNASDA